MEKTHTFLTVVIFLFRMFTEIEVTEAKLDPKTIVSGTFFAAWTLQIIQKLRSITLQVILPLNWVIQSLTHIVFRNSFP